MPAWPDTSLTAYCRGEKGSCQGSSYCDKSHGGTMKTRRLLLRRSMFLPQSLRHQAWLAVQSRETRIVPPRKLKDNSMVHHRKKVSGRIQSPLKISHPLLRDSCSGSHGHTAMNALSYFSSSRGEHSAVHKTKRM